MEDHIMKLFDWCVIRLENVYVFNGIGLANNYSLPLHSTAARVTHNNIYFISMIYFKMIVALFMKHLPVLTYGMILFPGIGSVVEFILLSFMKKYRRAESLLHREILR